MKSTLTICLFAFIALISAEGFAQSGKQVQKAFELEIKKLDKAFDRKLEDLEDEYAEEYEKKKQAVIEKLKASQNKAMNEQDLDEAVRLRDIAKELVKLKPPRDDEKVASDPFDNTNWDFLGTSMQRINGFQFKTNGRIVAENSYSDASWVSLRKDTILFTYGKKNSYIVFHRQKDQSLFKGYHSGGGVVRHIRRISQ